MTRAIEAARAAAAVGALPFSLWIAGRDAATSDRLAVAIALYEEAIRLARETGQATALCAGLSGLACVEARLGRADACREHAAEALAETAPLGVAFFRTWAFDALAEIELGVGDVQEAVKWLEEKERLLAERGIEDPDSSPVPELVEALVRLDRAQEAAERLEPLRHRRGGQGPAVVAGAARALPRPARRRRAVRRGARAAPAHAGPLRGGPDAALPRRGAAARAPARRRRANTCAPPSRASTRSAPSRGPSARAASCSPAARPPAAATR